MSKLSAEVIAPNATGIIYLGSGEDPLIPLESVRPIGVSTSNHTFRMDAIDCPAFWLEIRAKPSNAGVTVNGRVANSGTKGFTGVIDADGTLRITEELYATDRRAAAYINIPRYSAQLNKTKKIQFLQATSMEDLERIGTLFAKGEK